MYKDVIIDYHNLYDKDKENKYSLNSTTIPTITEHVTLSQPSKETRRLKIPPDTMPETISTMLLYVSQRFSSYINGLNKWKDFTIIRRRW